MQYLITQRELNSHQRQWIELSADYDISILYQPGKENMVVDSLSQRLVSIDSLAHLVVEERSLALHIKSLGNMLVHLDVLDPNRVLAFLGLSLH